MTAKGKGMAEQVARAVARRVFDSAKRVLVMCKMPILQKFLWNI